MSDCVLRLSTVIWTQSHQCSLAFRRRLLPQPPPPPPLLLWMLDMKMSQLQQLQDQLKLYYSR